MYNTTAEYKAEIKRASRSFDCKITIGDRIFHNEDIVDIKLSSNIQPYDGFMIGSTTSQTIDLTLLNKSGTIFTTNQVKLEIGLKIGSTIEYIPMGIFNIDDVEKTDYTIKLSCFDNMIKFETPYFSSLGDTTTLQQVVNELASKTGVPFIGTLPAYTVKKLEGFTCREILSYVASVCGGNATITRDGKFTIVYPREVSCSITGDNYIDLKREEVKYKLGKVTCQNKEKGTISKGGLGTDSMELLFENPWVTETILTDIYNKLKDFEYLGYTMKWQGDLALDVGDIITVTDIKGVVRKLPILSQKFTYTGGLTSEISAQGESKNKNSFSSNGSMNNKVERVVTDLALVNKAFVDYAHINNADIVNLKSETAKIGSLEVETANINNLLAGNIGAGNVQTIHLTGKNVVIDDAVIKSAMIDEVSANKVNAGQLNTNLVDIISESGNMLIKDNTIQIKDSTRPRVQIGKDASNDYNMYVWDSTGKLMFDATGLKADGIKNKIIRDDMISDAANINGKKINIDSLVTEVNKDTNIQLIKASKVNIDLEGQTLDVAFKSLSSTLNNIQLDGRNLFIEGTATANSYIDNTGQIIVNNGSILSDYIEVEENISYMFNTGGNVVLRIGLYDKNKVFLSRYLSTTADKPTQYTIPNGIKYIRFSTDGYKKDSIKIERGIEATKWTPAPEELGDRITSMQTSIKANIDGIDTLVKETDIKDDGKGVKLQDFYSTFKQTKNEITQRVESVETIADNSKSSINNMFSDNKVTPVEKKELKKEWDSIVKNYASNLSLATTLKANTADYTSKYNALNTALSGVFTDMATTTDRNLTNLRAAFVNYYDAEKVLLNGLTGGINKRVGSTEQKLTPSGITTTITEAINSGGNNKIDTTSFIMAKDGFTVKNGAIKVLNKASEEVLKADVNGNLQLVGNFTTLRDNKKAIEILGTIMNFYDWVNRDAKVGSISSVIKGTNVNKKGITIANEKNSFLSLSYYDDVLKGYYDYITLDNDYVTDANGYGSAIWIKRNVEMGESNLYFGPKGSIYNSVNDALTLNCFNKISLSLNTSNYVSLERERIINGVAYPILTWANTWCNSHFHVDGDFSARGSKACIEDTKNYGEVLSLAVESPQAWRYDNYFGKTDENGECIIHIDDVFIEIANTDMDYIVTLQERGEGALRPVEFTPTWFKIKGTPNLKFSCKIEALRKGTELERNLKFNNEDTIIPINFDEEIATDNSKEIKEILNKEIQFNLGDYLLY